MDVSSQSTTLKHNRWAVRFQLYNAIFSEYSDHLFFQVATRFFTSMLKKGSSITIEMDPQTRNIEDVLAHI